MDKPQWEIEFDKRTNPDNFEKGEYSTLLGDHLFDPSNFPESSYELDTDKIKNFIASQLSSQKQRMVEVAESLEKNVSKIVSESFKVECNGYNKALFDIKSQLKNF